MERTAYMIAITDNLLETQLRDQLLRIEPVISGVILRLPWHEERLADFIQLLLDGGFNKDKLIIHSNCRLLEHYQLSRIHFRAGDPKGFDMKKSRPDVTVSMAVHSAAECPALKAAQIDYGIFSPLFATPSKPGVQLRTDEEITQALAAGLPLIALGGITTETVSQLPSGFVTIAGIRLFQQDNATLQAIKEVLLSKRMT
ncbi:thiamine phosphate synthase [Macrococcus equipercicus]|nr:thiamine phosphate synthase [Macrococcus equipercicus]UTH14188.1 thiamine phosphate synthase [Macrococcus equipercicus]